MVLVCLDSNEAIKIERNRAQLKASNGCPGSGEALQLCRSSIKFIVSCLCWGFLIVSLAVLAV